MNSIFDSFSDALSCLSLDSSPQSIRQIIKMQPAIHETFQLCSLAYSALKIKEPFESRIPAKAGPIGLNTVGMLVDRLAILSIKSYFERKKNPNNDQSRIISQAKDIEACISHCRPGFSSDFSKITSIKPTEREGGFNLCSHKLAAVNTCLWLAQDVLYLRGPDSLPYEELRSYIAYFAEQNINRNWLIEFSEKSYWI
jgi:hypothetical protein